MNTSSRSIFGLLLIAFCILPTAFTQQVLTNVTVAPMLATFTGSWACNVPGGQAINAAACPTGCRSASVGDTMRIAFEGSAAWLSIQQDVASSVVLSIQLDEAQTVFVAGRDDGTSGCYGDVLVGSNLDPTKLHMVSVSIIDAGPGEAFMFGGLTVTLSQTDTTALSPSSDNNVSGQTSLEPVPERTAVIIGVLGGVTAFWILAGLGLWQVRRVQHDALKHPFHGSEVMSVDKTQTQTIGVGVGADSQATMINQSIGVDSAGSLVAARVTGAVVQRSVFGTTRTTSSASSYPATVDVPLPPSFPVPLPSVPSLPTHLISNASTQPLGDPTSRTLALSSRETAKWELELQRTGEEGSVKTMESTYHQPSRMQGQEELTGATNEIGFMSAGRVLATSAAPPLYEANSAQYANGLQRRWM